MRSSLKISTSSVASSNHFHTKKLLIFYFFCCGQRHLHVDYETKVIAAGFTTKTTYVGYVARMDL